MNVISFRSRKRLAVVFAAMLSLVVLCCVADADTARKLLKLTLNEDGRSAVVEVPAGYRSVTLQRFTKSGGWEKVASRKSDGGELRFKLPKAGKDVRWRAIGRFESAEAPRGKFPAAFYQGGSRFNPTKGDPSSINSRAFADLAGAPPESGGEIPEEADIWKVDGNTVYFFNQLRGLQVLDLADPAAPVLTGSLRLPAVGEDLYLLPGTGKVRHLALLTERYDNDGGAMTRIQIVRVEGGNLSITSREDVLGSLSDSRMVGNRLILATNEWGGEVVANDGSVSDFGSTSHITQWLLATGKEPKAEGGFDIVGMNPLIAAGAGWLAVAVNPLDDWDHSDVTVFGMDASGLTKLTPSPIRTAGVIGDKFKMRWQDHVLTTISEKTRRDDGSWTPVTLLENFRVWAADAVHIMMEEGRLAKLELAEGESLYATRFADDKAYIVTFEQTDPLWVVDLTDPKNPVIAGSLEVPGWSTHLEPIGDKLFAIGWDNDTVVASLFDVADASKPALLDRLDLGPPGTYSEAAWDEKALKVLASEGFAMVPLTTYDSTTGNTASSVRIVDVHAAAGKLALRGAIYHTFDARRADLLGNSVVSISQRVMVTADIADRDKPSVLAEVSLAWPVDRVLDAGNHLIHIEDGNAWGYGRATARVSPADNCEAIVSETDLGAGVVRGADLRDGKLYVLRERSMQGGMVFLRKTSDEEEGNGRITLDVYDATALPTLTKLASCSRGISSSMRVTGAGLLWPQANRPVVVLDAGSMFWFGMANVKSLSAASFAEAASTPKRVGILPVGDRFPFWRPVRTPRLLAFDVTNASAPSVGEPVRIGNTRTIPNGFYQAGGGLVVLGAEDWKEEADGEWYPEGSALRSVYVTEVPVSGEPVVRPVIDLPGDLFAVSELDAEGFLAFTRNDDSSGIKVSACDGYDAFEIGGLDADAGFAAAAGGRRLFLAVKDGVERHRLNDKGMFVSETALELGWTPDSLRWTDGVLLGGTWNKLFAVDANAAGASTWRFSGWGLGFDEIRVATDGDLLVPFGEYGAERLER